MVNSGGEGIIVQNRFGRNVVLEENGIPNIGQAMRITILSILLFGIFLSSGKGQRKDENLTNWDGRIKVHQFELKLIFKLNSEKCYLDIPAQAIQNYPASKLNHLGDSINIAFSGMFEARFEGINDKDVIVGNWIQLGKNYPLTLRKKKEYSRPQTPKPPFPYEEEVVSYFNQARSVKFGGTLTIPKKGNKHPLAILISGSGRQDRDETIFGHKPFLVIADYLTRQGIAVLRVDDRGIGQTTGKETLGKATSYDFAMDVIAGIEYLKNRKDINHSQIGLIGHSEGGIIASIAGAKRNDVAFIVSLAGVGVTGEKLILSQIEKSLQRSFPSPSIDSIMTIEKTAIDIINQESNDRLAEVAILRNFTSLRLVNQDSIVKKFYGMKIKDGFETYDLKTTGDRFRKMMLPWYRYLLLYNPSEFLPKVKAPFLALNGEKDTQVLSDLNLNGFRSVFDKYGKRNYKTISYPGLNHFFQHCKTGYFDEMELIEETFSPEVLNDMSTWIKEQIETK